MYTPDSLGMAWLFECMCGGLTQMLSRGHLCLVGVAVVSNSHIFETKTDERMYRGQSRWSQSMCRLLEYSPDFFQLFAIRWG